MVLLLGLFARTFAPSANFGRCFRLRQTQFVRKKHCKNQRFFWFCCLVFRSFLLLFCHPKTHKHGVGERLGPVGLGVGANVGPPVGDGVGDTLGPVGAEERTRERNKKQGCCCSVGARSRSLNAYMASGSAKARSAKAWGCQSGSATGQSALRNNAMKTVVFGLATNSNLLFSPQQKK